ncbi:TrbL/VirB6 family protein [Actinophytocola sp. KF-1]
MLALSIVALLVGVLAISGLTVRASAQPSTPPAPVPPASATPLPDSCEHNQLPYCFPSTTPEQPATSTSATPCSGEDCIPQPTTPGSPSTGPEQPGDGGGAAESECGISDVGACITEAINGMFRGIVEAALSPILDLIGHTALSTPTIGDLPGIGELWNSSWEIVVAAYALLILVGGIVVMGHESVQTRYSIKEIGPRIPVAFVASALSLFFADKLIRLANGLTLGILGGGAEAPSLGDTLNEAITGVLTGGLFIILVGLVLVVMGLGLLVVYVVRIVITLILIVSGPLFLMCHALPHTDPLARWWWKALAATLGVQVAQALVLITAVRTFLSGGVHLFGSTLSALGMLVAAIALFFILFKIPFWLLRAVKVSSGRSFLGGLARAYIAAKTFGMVADKAGAFGKAGTADTGTRRNSSRGGAAAPPQPAQPRVAPTPEMVNKRLQAAHDAERARAARRPRLPSQAPRFLQPMPQDSIHDPAVTPAYKGSTKPEFSSAPTPATSTPRRGRRSGSAPEFQAAGGPRRRGTTPPPARPIRTASVPAQLQFRPATPSARQPSQPVKPSSAPAAPVFRQAQPEPRIGDAYRRTQSVPPPLFRAPKPAPGGEAT